MTELMSNSWSKSLLFSVNDKFEKGRGGILLLCKLWGYADESRNVETDMKKIDIFKYILEKIVKI